MKLTISGYSTALFSTWYFVHEFGLLFDAGDGVVSHLLQKSRKIKHIFISHPDRDHLTGLLQLNQLNAYENPPTIYYPKDSGSFPALEQFSKRFDPHVAGSRWIGIDDGQEIEIKPGYIVKAIKNGHLPQPNGVIKSLSFQLIHVKRKLKPEYLNLPGKEIQQLRETQGIAAITYEVREKILSYSGDTPVEDHERWKDAGTLIHEATFLDKGENSGYEIRENKHSSLGEVMEMVAASDVERLILGHFSSRYSNAEIDAKIHELSQQYGVNIPIYRVLPGDFLRDILTTGHLAK